MKRRDFLTKGLGAGVFLGMGTPLVRSAAQANPAEASEPKTTPEALRYDLVAVRGGDAAGMFDRGISALGGMSRFVSSGQTVVVKPNIGWDKPPEMAANTNPDLVGRIVQRCLEAGASRVYVLDHTCDEWRACYANSGIERAARAAGAQVVPANSERYYLAASIPHGRRLKETKEHELIARSDVLINVPILKHHGGASLTSAMKNLMGNVWDRRFYHSNDLHQCIADYATLRRPTLNVVDAYRVLLRNGPRGGSLEDVVTMEAQVLSPDLVAADAAASLLFGTQPHEVGHIRLGEAMGLGTTQLDQLNIARLRM